ncbi:MAG TPA: glycosyltransferase [Bacteroidia bacterium]|nr:glycosyltransferase [Bacteroidia bacterium]
MQLSIIIVNYNVKHFVEQCLHSVYKALKGIEAEVFVVDNNSVDGSVALIKEKFPQVILMDNKVNAGFSKANNQAIRQSKGKYVLLLNPDTVVQEDTFAKTLAFMENTPGAGGLGVKMVDGKGNFLPESKRGLPTPEVAFYKIFGLSKLFQGSKRFGRYHLTYLDKNKTHEVDVLSGAFMLLRRETLDKCGLLDEDYFMYGEDIDLSYRIVLSGYKNYYYPDTCIIHYKGESTKKSSINYVFVFYRAMAIFARKHFSDGRARMFSFIINFAIYLRAGISISWRLIKQLFVPALDFTVIFLGLLAVKEFYEKQVKFTGGEGAYAPHLVKWAFLAYSFIWVLSIFFSGGYDKPIKLVRIIRGVIIGMGLILIGYSLLPEAYRFSRALILLGSASTLLAVLFLRLIFHLVKVKGYVLWQSEHKRIAVVGSSDEYARVSGLLKETGAKTSFVGFVSIDENAAGQLGNISQLNEVIEIHQVQEIIFCSKDLSSQQIISHMLQLVSASVDFKIAPPESLSIIGSNSIDTAGDLYVIDFNSVSKPHNKRNKRVLDILSSLTLLAFLPVTLLVQKKPLPFIYNLFLVLFGAKTWVGYEPGSDPRLPRIKKAVLAPYAHLHIDDAETKNKINLSYSKDYRIEKDLKIILANFRQLGSF